MKKVMPFLFLLFSCNLFALDIQEQNLFPKVLLETSMGNITIELNRSQSPKTVDNFLRYVVEGEYNNTIFHRIIPGFVVQGGGFDANYKEKKSYAPIINESGNGLKNLTGTIAMARSNSPHSATRQFYFNLNDNLNLDSNKDWGYAVFGKITAGRDVLERMGKVATELNKTLRWPNVPVDQIVLTKAILLPE